VAAFGQLERHARRQPAHRDRALLLGPILGFGHVRGTARHERLHDLPIIEPGLSDGDHEVFLATQLQPLDRFGQSLFADVRRQALNDLVIELAPDRRFGAFLLPHGATDRCACLARHGKGQPRKLRPDVRLLMISTTSPLTSGVRKGTWRPLILAPTAAAPRSVWTAKAKSIGVALGQLKQRALGRESEDAILVHRHLRVFEQFLGIAAGVENSIRSRSQPTCASGCVPPACRPNAQPDRIRWFVHFPCLDLNFDAHRIGIDQ
jgi:hypothetical protein